MLSKDGTQYKSMRFSTACVLKYQYGVMIRTNNKIRFPVLLDVMKGWSKHTIDALHRGVCRRFISEKGLSAPACKVNAGEGFPVFL